MAGENTRQRMVTRALRRVLRPLVRFLIHEQISFVLLGDLLRSLYVEVADTDFRIEGKTQSASRVALLTGVHRREVKHQRERDREQAPENASVTLGARLIADWRALPQFLDEEGRPLPLNRSSRRPGPSIKDLAETAGQDIRPQAILDEWLRLGVVEIGPDNRILLRRESFVPERGVEEKLDFFGRILSAHVDTSVRNVMGAASPRLDQVVYYGGLRPASAERLRARARALAVQALSTWNREARVAQDADRGSPDATRRLHFGAYLSEDDGGNAS